MEEEEEERRGRGEEDKGKEDKGKTVVPNAAESGLISARQRHSSRNGCLTI